MDVGFKYRKSGKLPKVKEVGFKYRDSGKLPKVKVPGTFYYLDKKDNKGNDISELWFCFSDTLIKRVDNVLNADEVNAVIKEYLEKNGGYATEKWVEDKDYATKTELGEYAKTEVLDSYATKTDIPTKLSELDNDSGYIKQAGLEKTLEDYVKKDDAAKKSVWEELTFID